MVIMNNAIYISFLHTYLISFDPQSEMGLVDHIADIFLLIN